MAKILVPMDGSETALRALDHAIRRRDGGEILLLHVQPAIPASVGDFVGANAVGGYHREEAEKALGAGKARLASAGIPHTAEYRTGNVADTIAAYAAETGCDEIVIGSRGSGGFAGMILGSVASRVLHVATVPVTIVK